MGTTGAGSTGTVVCVFSSMVVQHACTDAINLNNLYFIAFGVYNCSNLYGFFLLVS